MRRGSAQEPREYQEQKSKLEALREGMHLSKCGNIEVKHVGSTCGLNNLHIHPQIARPATSIIAPLSEFWCKFFVLQTSGYCNFVALFTNDNKLFYFGIHSISYYTCSECNHKSITVCMVSHVRKTNFEAVIVSYF